jgi:hypothetical protein
MEWLKDLVYREQNLRRHIAAMQTAARRRDPAMAPTGERFLRCVEPEVQAIDALLEDYLCGRTEEECSRMRFEARLSLPVYSHLRNLFLAPAPGRR